MVACQPTKHLFLRDMEPGRWGVSDHGSRIPASNRNGGRAGPTRTCPCAMWPWLQWGIGVVAVRGSWEVAHATNWVDIISDVSVSQGEYLPMDAQTPSDFLVAIARLQQRMFPLCSDRCDQKCTVPCVHLCIVRCISLFLHRRATDPGPCPDHQPPTANRQPPTANRQPPPTANRQSLKQRRSHDQEESVPANLRFCWRYEGPLFST